MFCILLNLLNILINQYLCVTYHVQKKTFGFGHHPFFYPKLLISKSITEQPRLLAAIPKDDLVLVLGSQNTFATILSGKRSSFRKLPWSSIKLLENSIRSNMSCFDRSVIERRLLAIS